jgi:hypothetical protein
MPGKHSSAAVAMVLHLCRLPLQQHQAQHRTDHHRQARNDARHRVAAAFACEAGQQQCGGHQGQFERQQRHAQWAVPGELKMFKTFSFDKNETKRISSRVVSLQRVVIDARGRVGQARPPPDCVEPR